MTNTVIGSFGCESYASLAWHLASCHWKMKSVPSGLIAELQGLDLLDLEALKQLRQKYVHPEPEASVLG
jgi:hypothetical protein